MPTPRQQFLDNNGNPCAGCLLYAFAAGTNTPQNTYADVTLATPNANPVVLDSAGRATVFLDTRLTYKFSLNTAADVPIWTVDSVDAVPSALNVEVSGVAGETLAQRQIVYLSSGLDATVAGRWYLTDADVISKSSGASLVGVVISPAIGALASGTIRIQGRVSGYSGLSEGLSYFVSATAGELTSVAPASVKVVGVAESPSTLLLTPSAATSGGVGAFSSLQVSGTAANSIDTAGGLEAGSGNVQVINAAGNVLETAIADGTILARVAAGETITGLWDFDSPTVFSAPNDRNIIIATNTGNGIAMRIRGRIDNNLGDVQFTSNDELTLYGSIGITPGGGLTYSAPSPSTLGHTFAGGRINSNVSQPGFLAYNSATDLGITTGATIQFDAESYDSVGNFASNTFTAPATGIYQLCVAVQVIPSISGQLGIILNTTDTWEFRESFASGDLKTLGGCALASMAASQTAHVSLTTTGATVTIGGGAVPFRTFFSGRLMP